MDSYSIYICVENASRITFVSCNVYLVLFYSASKGGSSGRANRLRYFRITDVMDNCE